MFDSVIVCPWKDGQQQDGVQNGAHAIAYFVKKFFDFSRYVCIHNNKNYTNEKYHSVVYEEARTMPGSKLLVGGDHSVAIGSVLSSIHNDNDTCVIWIDAHADINTIDSSTSKNLHGMPLSFICGTENAWKWTHPLKKLGFNNLFYFGVRDIDEYELNILKKEKIKRLSNINEISGLLSLYNTMHVSFDVDALDPKDMHSTGTRSDQGVPLDEIIDLFSILSLAQSNGKTIHVDICEYNPLIGNTAQKETSWKSLENILCTLC
jgi:arginase